ncbi:hypothetical protein C7M52_01373 [Mixta theicola]|nr:DUF943 family protein [Mixta theicola]QHM75419.1 hypothetical protein C7M52_01373 [Mixta theicola]
MELNKKYHIPLVLSCVLLLYAFWFIFRPVKIIAVHQHGSRFSSVLVNHFPLTDRGKINWWLENRTMLKEKYHVPATDKKSYFSVIFWLFGEGYKERGKYDLLCFDDMKSEKRCIEKDAVFIVSHTGDDRTYFTMDGARYLLKSNGEWVTERS